MEIRLGGRKVGSTERYTHTLKAKRQKSREALEALWDLPPNLPRGCKRPAQRPFGVGFPSQLRGFDSLHPLSALQLPLGVLGASSCDLLGWCHTERRARVRLAQRREELAYERRKFSKNRDGVGPRCA